MEFQAALDEFSVWVPGKPMSWRRPRFNNKRAFTDPVVEEYQGKIFARWVDAGSPRIETKYWEVDLLALWERPASHILSDGVTLSAIGKRMPWPAYMDGDNLLKHIDVLVHAKAVPDDRYAVRKWYGTRWDEEDTGLLFTCRSRVPDVWDGAYIDGFRNEESSGV